MIGQHYCYQKAMKGKNRDKFKYAFLDFECSQDDAYQCAEGYTPNNEKRCSIYRGFKISVLGQTGQMLAMEKYLFSSEVWVTISNVLYAKTIF